jgi:ABC-2 type transport system permease protein
MIDYIRTMIWKEWKEFVQSHAGPSKTANRMRVLIAVIVFGFFIPYRGGARYIENPLSLVLPSIVPVLFIMSLVTDSFAGERERHTLETLLASQLPDGAILMGKVITAVLFAWLLSVGMLVLGMIGANISSGQSGLRLFPLDRVVAALVFNFLLSLVVSSAGVLVSLRASTVRQAMQTLSVGFMVVFYGFVLGVPFLLPATWRARLMEWFAGQNLFRTELLAAALLIVMAALLFCAARLRFRRARLILD